MGGSVHSLENPSAVAVLVKYAPELAVIVVVAVSACVVVVAPAPYNVAPTRGLHLAGCLLPYQQTPLVSCMAEFHHSEKFVACLVQSCAVPSEVTLDGSSPPLVYAYLLQPLHSTSFACCLPLLAIAEEELEEGPLTGSMAGDQLDLIAVEVGESWLPEAAILYAAVT